MNPEYMKKKKYFIRQPSLQRDLSICKLAKIILLNMEIAAPFQFKFKKKLAILSSKNLLRIGLV